MPTKRWWQSCHLLGHKPDKNRYCWYCGLVVGKYFVWHPTRQPVRDEIEIQYSEASKEHAKRLSELWRDIWK